VTGKKYWIGLTNPEDSTSSYWLDGSSSKYRLWEDGKPDADDKTCVYFEPDKFKEEECSNTERYVCKKGNGTSSSTGKATSTVVFLLSVNFLIYFVKCCMVDSDLV